ncbi:carbohydrate-binding domain-containing protein [Treponema sp.]|uniref:carbohydrate-binding domain-containing protein n=1 Tax=Treponema sp. TaxID=166 RepID=UPI003FA23884
MKTLKKKIRTFGIVLLITAILGCQAATKQSAVQAQAVNAGQAQIAVEQRDTSQAFTRGDFDAGYTTASAKINVGSLANVSASGVRVSGKTATISAAGTYIFSGNANDVCIIVDAPDAEVRLVLDNLNITNSSTAPVYVKNAAKVYVTLAENSTNTLSVKGVFVKIDGAKAEAVIFAQSDLTLNGSGTLNATAQNGSGITSKKNLVITGGTFDISASSHALKGKDNVNVAGGRFTLTSGKDGIHSKNDDNAESGNIYIKGGTFVISAEGEALDAINNIKIDGGSIDIVQSDEGMEATTIDINGGKITLVSSDDGINTSYSDKEEIAEKSAGTAASASSVSSSARKKGGMQNISEQAMHTYLNITGGEITIDSQADGIDSNGSVYISGGTVRILGPASDNDAALDYDVRAVITGGEFIASGSAGMAQGFSEESTQASFVATFSKTVSGNISVTDKTGKIIVQTNSGKSFRSVVVSSKDLKVGETYTVKAGSESVSVTLSSITTGGGMQGGPGGMHGAPGNMRGGPGGIKNGRNQNRGLTTDKVKIARNQNQGNRGCLKSRLLLDTPSSLKSSR